MNVKSARFRLTFWYSAAFFLAMAVIFTAFYLITKQVLVSHTDASINSHAQKIIETVLTDSTPMDQSVMPGSQLFSQEFSETPGMLIVVTDQYGKIISSSQALGGNTGVISDLLEKSANVIIPAFTDRIFGTVPLRLGIFPVKKDGIDIGLVLVGHPNDVVDNSLRTLTIILLLVYFGLLIPTVGGGFLLARGAMAPITETSAKLKKISSSNLDERVDVPMTGDEVQELNETFNNLLDRLSEAFNRERQFIGDVAHELKTPLAIMKTGVEITLTKDRSKDEYKKVLGDNLDDINRLSNTLKNVLDLAWSEADHTTLQQEHFSLSELAEELKDMASQMGQTVNGKVEKNILVFGKREKVFRALSNILDNAIKYSPKDKNISLTLKRDNNQAKIKIHDEGPGISEEDLPHIFERFYRGSKTAKVLGSGLGLAIASSIINIHQGKIAVDSEIGKGTTVTITLPAYSLHKIFIH